MNTMTLSVIIPAYNEAERIEAVICGCVPFADEICVIDDGSADDTAAVARRAGATVIRQPHHGYIHALKTGLCCVNQDIVVTLDADGEHTTSDIPFLVAPILKGEADMVLGKRDCIPSVSERLIGFLVRLKTPVSDHGTGIRAIKRDLAQTLELKGKCTCGTLVLEALSKGAVITEVPITIQKIKKRRKRKWIHAFQIVYVLFQLIQLSID
jgi:glycosyltransferase involved in cell wall biosynthesis